MHAWIEAAILGLARADRGVHRGLLIARSVTAGVLGTALSSDERRRLTLRIFDARPTRREELFVWERSFFDAHLPVAPARVLVGGAGAGREVRALRARGLHVDALEPAASAAAKCRDALGNEGDVVECDYGALARAVLEGEDNAASVLASRRYNAILLGWASLSYLQSADEHHALLRACDRLTSGPILASFLRGERLRSERAEDAGRRVGQLLASLRGVAPASAHVGFASNYGFAWRFSNDELDALARATDRTLVWGDALSFPHAAFIRTKLGGSWGSDAGD